MPETIRKNTARVRFMEYLATHSPTTRIDMSGPTPSVPSILRMERAGLFTTRSVNPHKTKRGATAHTMEFTITDAGRAWLANVGAVTP